MARYSMVIDLRKCLGCQSCTVACCIENSVMTTETWHVVLDLMEGEFPAIHRTFYPRPCMHCKKPPCVEVCPTGALLPTSEYEMRAAGTWDEDAQATTDTICAFCGVGCGLTLHVQDNTIVKVTSPEDNPITHGNLCIKGRFGFTHVQDGRTTP